MNNRVSSIFSPTNGEFISPFTAPAMPNLRKRMSVMQKPIDAKRIPRSPLEPEKLAKLANALGISAPLPASNAPSSSVRRTDSSPRPGSSRSSPQSGSATPGSAQLQQQPPSTRYLLHVVPPKHFPHPSKNDEPEAFATFRRGCVVPLYSSLQAQVAAIAREYNLPTGHGIVLYLINDTGRGRKGKAVLGKGPRIGDDVWKWLWTKVSEEMPTGGASGIGLGISRRIRASPEAADRPSLLRKSASATQLGTPRTPDFLKDFPLTPPASSGSTAVEGPEDTKEEGEPSTSSTPGMGVNGVLGAHLDTGLLPGLGSPSLMPVLAKVEFDIDRSVGAWYEVWARSRKSNRKHKRKAAQGKLKLRMTIQGKNFVRPPSPLSSSSSSESEDEEEEEEYPSYSKLEEDEQPTARPARIRQNGDPLSDVFGTDGEAWSDAQADRPVRRQNGDLALDGASLSVEQDSDKLDCVGISDEEVITLWNEQGKPQLNGGVLRKAAPPPLDLSRDNTLDTGLSTPSPYLQPDGTVLPYLKAEPEKRLGGIYDDLELGLDADDIDFDQHRDRQLKVRQELDELEKNLAQFSPRALKTLDLDVAPQPSIQLHSAPPDKTAFSARSDSLSKIVQMPHSARESTDPSRKVMSPPQFRQPNLVGTPGTPSPIVDNFRAAEGSSAGSQWPSAPYSALSNRNEADPQSPTNSTMQRQSRHINNTSSPSPPRVVLNGKTTPGSRKNSPSVASVLSPAESARLSTMYEQDASFYAEKPSVLQPSLTRRNDSVDSPVLPLSPDPFGRFPSNGEPVIAVPAARMNTSRGHLAPSSRFSVDSVGEEEVSVTPKGKNNIVSMKSIRKLWRKSNKGSISSTQPTPPMPSRPPSSVLSLNTEVDASRTPSPNTPVVSKGLQKPARQGSRDSGLDPFYFDQESKYPQRRQTPSPSPHTAFQFPPQSAASSRSVTPSGVSPSSSQHQQTPSQGGSSDKKRSTRKSLVSKWKGGSDGGSGNGMGGGNSSTDSISAAAADGTRKRRPSMLDVGGLMRSSVSSTNTSASIAQSPSMPELPAIFRNPESQSGHSTSPSQSQASSHTRLTSRGSMSTLLTMASNIDAERSVKDAANGRRKAVTQSSTDSSASTQEPDMIPTPVSVVAPLQFHRNKGSMPGPGSDTMSEVTAVSLGGAPGMVGEGRIGSMDTASDGLGSMSFDESQFEIVTGRGH